MPEGPSWEEYRIHLASELDRMASILEKLTDRIEGVERAMLASGTESQLRAKWAGAIWGAIMAAVVAVADYLTRKH